MTRLKDVRVESGMTQKELAERSDISIRIVQSYEQGQRDINRAQALTVHKLARAMDHISEDILELPE